MTIEDLLEDLLDGSEDLLLGDAHVVGDVGEDGRLDEVAAVAVALAARQQAGALLLARLDQRQDLVELVLVDLRALLDVQVERVAHRAPLRPRHTLSHELVVDLVLDEDARAGAAALALSVASSRSTKRQGPSRQCVFQES